MISYSALTSYGKATLPSVEVWNGNFDIIKDPPSGIHTRRIIKVGDNNDLLERNDDSGARINEMINVYARGNNPMVTVQYSNHGNTGSGLMGISGGTSGSNMSSLFTEGGGGKLPYRVMDNGAFRPPILRQEDLLPLSRMPRGCASVTSKRCRVDQTKRITPDVVEYFKEVHKAPLKVAAQSQKSFRKETPPETPSNIGLMINSNALRVSAHSNIKKSKDLHNQRVIPDLESPLHASNVDHINQRRPGQHTYIHAAPQLSKNVPHHEAGTVSNLNIKRNPNVYELAGQTVKLTENRPDRQVSHFSATSGAKMAKIGQDRMLSGVTLKLRPQ
jgi:hypothetical protein